VDFEAPELAWGDGAAIWRGRGQNFLVEWVDCAPGAELLLAGEHETILIMPDANFEIRWAGKPGMATAAPSVAITPVGEGTVTAPQGGTVIALSPQPELAADVIDAGIYATPDRQVAAIGAPYERVGAQDVQIVDMARLRPPADRPRLRVLQSASVSINWVVYEGPRTLTGISNRARWRYMASSSITCGGHGARMPIFGAPTCIIWPAKGRCSSYRRTSSIPLRA